MRGLTLSPCEVGRHLLDEDAAKRLKIQTQDGLTKHVQV